ncbi:MAG: hypothetical protein M4579_004266 [Chaenotheca gracillima]|nr:MAG: hypothetical protein M4579_004266 [Chaenotheca gracillima]
MSYSYERVDRRGVRQNHGGRGLLGFWMPLALTVTVATMGIAAWAWSERRDDDEDDYDNDNDRREGGQGNTGSGAPPPPQYGDLGRGETSFTAPPPAEGGPPGGPSEEGMMSRMSGALGRTPSPQQIFDGASRTVAAGMAAAGAVVGGALASIREEDKDDYADHSRWSEEGTAADQAEGGRAGPNAARTARAPTGAPSGGVMAGESAMGATRSTGQPQRPIRRKTVAIVLSAESKSGNDGGDGGYYEEASILSHLPTHINHATTRLFVLIYTPDLKQGLEGSVASSYSNIGHDDARSPGEEQEKPLTSIDPNPVGSPSGASPTYNALHSHALTLVEDETMILPFTTPTGHVHMLRHLAPEIVYVQESLSGTNGDAVTHISGWVGQVIVVVGAEGGHGGLIDSEDEAGKSKEHGDHWWQSSDRVGLGKGVDVVDGMRVGDDWAKRVGGLE